MKQYKLMQGNNIESLKKLPDNSIDSVVTDPPYGLSFMGKKWDYDVPSVEFWKEVYRVLKPGGHILSFGGTRTYHRMAVNIEDAGFEIRDQIQWLYGCLDDKSEILTDSGWKKYTEINLNDKALSWNSELNVLEFNKIDDIIIKPYKGDMVLLKNKHTEQILTPNHRVYHKYERKERGYLGENWEVVEAGDMKKSGKYTLPLASYYEGEGIGGEDYAALLGWIWSEGEFDKKGNAIRISQSSINQPLVDEIKELIERLNIKYSHYSRERFYNYKHKGLQSYIDNSFYFSTENEINNKIRTDLPNKKLNFDFVKTMTIKEKIAFLDAAHKGDGSKGRETIYQNDLSQLKLLQFMYLTIGKSSYFDLNKMAINFRNKETTQLQHKNLNKKVYYEGDVWCVRVKNSAFVARRGDKVFITGNSGFPKSHNIGKAVDKIEGNERTPYERPDFVARSNKTEQRDSQCISGEKGKYTKGTSPYEGWGTALKPANEPICLARKPLSEKSVAENVLKWKTGGINIDGCRIELNGDNTSRKTYENKVSIGAFADRPNMKEVGSMDDKWQEGRFPANIILDETAAELLDEQSGITSVTGKRSDKSIANCIEARKNNKGNSQCDIGGNIKKITEYANDKGGASRYFFNVKNSGGTEDFFIYKENNIVIWNIKSLDTQEYNTEESIEASDALKQARESICQKPELYGNNTMVKYLTNTISITKMKTHSIMTFPILNASTKTSIGHFTLMIDEKQSQLLTEESILNVQIVSNQNALVSSIKTNQEVLVDIVSYVLEENLVSGETTIESTITSIIENIGSNRFLYIAKVSKKERNMGLDGFECEIKLTPTIKLIVKTDYNNKNLLWEKQDLKTELVDTDKSHQKDIEEYGAQQREDKLWSTDTYGNYIMEQFQKDFKSITEMEINSTTIYQILNSSIQKNTKTYIQELYGEMVKDINFVEDVEKKSTKMIFTLQEEKTDGYTANVKSVLLKGMWSISVKENKCSHPTLKPINLMSYLCRLITPPGGIVLDPFMGSGSTGIAARLEGFKFCGMEMDKDYFKIAEARIDNYEKYRDLLKNK